MILKRNFITNEEFIHLHNTIGIEGMARKFDCTYTALRGYRRKYVKEIKINIRELRIKQSAALVRHFEKERKAR